MLLPPRAYVFIGLNIVRTLSIIALILVFASNTVTLSKDIKAFNHYMSTRNDDTASSSSNSTSGADTDYINGSTVPNQVAGIFWAVLNRLFILMQALFLVLSEIRWPGRFFDQYFPVLGNDFGLGAIGIIQCLIGAAILSHYVDNFTLVAAFFLFGIGCLNMFLGLIFRQKVKVKRSLTSWRDHAKSALPSHVGGIPTKPVVSAASNFFDSKKGGKGWADLSSSSSSSSVPGSPKREPGDWKGALGFGRQGEKRAALNGYFISKPIESLPRYAPGPTAR